MPQAPKDTRLRMAMTRMFALDLVMSLAQDGRPQLARLHSFACRNLAQLGLGTGLNTPAETNLREAARAMDAAVLLARGNAEAASAHRLRRSESDGGNLRLQAVNDLCPCSSLAVELHGWIPW